MVCLVTSLLTRPERCIVLETVVVVAAVAVADGRPVDCVHENTIHCSD